MTIKGTSEELDATKQHIQVSANDNVMQMKATSIPKLSRDRRTICWCTRCSLTIANPIAHGEDHKLPVPETTTVIFNVCNENNDIYEDTIEPNKSTHYGNSPLLPILSPGRN